MKIFKITLRIRREKGIWCEVYARAKTIELAIEKAAQKESKASGLDLVCCAAVETDIELI